MSYLKLIEAGVAKETLGLLAVPLAPLQIILPFIISRMLSGKEPFKYYTSSFFLKYVFQKFSYILKANYHIGINLF